MSVAERRLREREARRRLIIAAARVLAEREGWDAVTTRRLSSEIEYSQPVIYKHFAAMEDLIEAIALEGFAELAHTLIDAQREEEDAIGAAARAYTNFACENPALYDAMFNRSTRLRFGPEKAAAPQRAAFDALRAAVATLPGNQDLDTLTEVVWAALHGLTMLGRQHRLRPDHEADRINLLVTRLRAASGGRRVRTK